MSAINDEIAALCKAAMDSKLEWLEDIVAGLMAAGCTKEEIQIQEHPNCRTVVCVRGVPKYEWKIENENERHSAARFVRSDR